MLLAQGNSQIDLRVHNELISMVDEREKMMKSKTKLWGKKANVKHWTCRNTADRCRCIGKDYEYLYNRLYPLMSWYVHSGSSGVINVDSKGLQLVFAKGHELSHSMFVEAIVIISKQFQIDKTIKDFQDVIRFLETVPGYVILESTKKELSKKEA